LALIGHPVFHSLSPKLYREFLGDKLQSYDLLDVQELNQLPDLNWLRDHYDGINITSPYKEFYFDRSIPLGHHLDHLRAVNVLAFKDQVYSTNTDYIAAKIILKRFHQQYPSLHLSLLGSGVMSRMVQMIAIELGLPYQVISRKTHQNISHVDFTQMAIPSSQHLIINACSRDYICKGKFSGHELFWDFNYHFLAHSLQLPKQVKSYQDGLELLRLQALAAIDFWDNLSN
jgi:shikimate 5-dehydrogenase